jgi:23S rRNA (cytidine1920-2'-O)/16S rRNA (cytidine1409-2'-O)-methyltransferase
VAVDVGHGQLAASLRADSRVVVMERTNARHLARSDLPWAVELVVVDASFISLETLLPAIAALLDPGGRLLALVKPQFEAGRAEARRGRGVIKDPEIRAAAIAKVRQAMDAHGFDVEDGCDSAVKGPKGNVEHFLLARRR